MNGGANVRSGGNSKAIYVIVVFLLVVAVCMATGVFLPYVQAAVATDGTGEARPPVTPPQQESPPPQTTVRPPNPPPKQQIKALPLTMTELRLRNEDKEGNELSDYKISFDYDEARWISYYARLVNNTGERLQGKLGIRYIQPDGKLKNNSKSPESYTFEQTVDLQESGELTGGWGNAAGGTFEPGRHRIEFWWAGQKIHQMTFAINEPDMPLVVSEIKLRNEAKDDTPLSEFGTLFKQEEIQFITFYIQMKNISSLPQKGKLGIKFFRPDGTLMQGNKSPEGYTLTNNIDITESGTASNGWGNSEGNAFVMGRHRVEFWWNGKRIGQAAFEVN
jgi:hypothetical protein